MGPQMAQIKATGIVRQQEVSEKIRGDLRKDQSADSRR